MTENLETLNNKEKNSNAQSNKRLTVEECEEKISELDRSISKLSDEIHSLESQLELQRSNVDVLEIKNKDNAVLQSFVMGFFLICFSIWLAFH